MQRKEARTKGKGDATLKRTSLMIPCSGRGTIGIVSTSFDNGKVYLMLGYSCPRSKETEDSNQRRNEGPLLIDGVFVAYYLHSISE